MCAAKPSTKLLLTLFAVLASAVAASAQSPTFQTLYTFPGGANAANPGNPLIFDRAGNLYGATSDGGSLTCNPPYGCGTVFELAPSTPRWKEKLLYTFSSTSFPQPYGQLSIGSNGDLYGTTAQGGDPVCNCGEIYQLVRGSDGWTQNILHTFTNNGSGDGQYPYSGLIQDASGNLYGTTESGGTQNAGTLFELTPASGGSWTYSIIYQFENASREPYQPAGPLTMDSAGDIYGTSQGGGLYGYGSVYKLSFSSGAWVATVLYNFTSDYGYYYPGPFGVVLGPSGNLYGTTNQDGEFGFGTIYELTPTAGYWNHTLLYTFTGGSDGADSSGVTIGPSGALYGTADGGGIFGYGTVFKLAQGANGKWTFSVLHSFKNGSDGGYPYGGVILDSLGNLYGTAITGGADNDGVAYKIVP
jgi:uncharacterized repeat protein (TIGR03803 family)